MKGLSLPAATDFEWKDPITGTPYGADRPCDELDQCPPKADEEIAHSRYLPASAQALAGKSPANGQNSLLRALRACGEPIDPGLVSRSAVSLHGFSFNVLV